MEPEIFRLRVTERALVHDLLLDPVYRKMDARDILEDLASEEHSKLASELPKDQRRGAALSAVADKFPVLAKFVEMRQNHPTGQERTRNLTHSTGRMWNLHAGDYRGVTWFDSERGTVWLCAAGFHRSGKPDDFYRKVEQLDADRDLAPTPEEIAEPFHSETPDLVGELSRRLPEVIGHARQIPESEISVVIKDAAHISVYVYALSAQDGEVYLGVRVVRADAGLDVFAAAVSIAFPDAEVGSEILFRSEFPHRSARAGELIASCVF